MKLNVIALALAVTAFGAIAAQADEIVVKERVAPGVVVKEQIGTPNVVVRERGTVGYRSNDCATRSVTRTNGVTDTKVTKTVKRCD